MSHMNWKVMSEKGVAGDGQDVVTCFVAALDCLLVHRDIPYKTYKAYTDAYRYQQQHGTDRRRTRNTIRETLQNSIGGSCLRNFVCKRASNLEDTILILNHAVEGNKKIIISVSPNHVVGLKPIRSGIWLMVGNSTPYDDELTTDEIFMFLYVPPCTEKKANRTNIYLIG